MTVAPSKLVPVDVDRIPVYLVDARNIPTYVLITDYIAVGANKDLVDIFNAAGTGYKVRILDILSTPDLDTGVVGVVSIELNLIRTSAIGTGGTAVSYKQTTLPNISPLHTLNAALPAGLTARVAPAGGATAAEWLTRIGIAPEETNTSMGYLAQLVRLAQTPQGGQRWTLEEGQGFKITQGAVASVGTVMFAIFFTLETT